MTNDARFDEPGSAATLAALRRVARPLATDADLDPLIEAIGNAHYVLIGEASHGTHEYYAWRAALSRRLIAERGFSFVAVEGDWPDCYRVNRYVKALPDSDVNAPEVLHAFRRWPTWMWANKEVVEFAEWLRRRNAALPAEARAGFYGLDLYSLWESLAEVTNYLRRVDPDALPSALNAFRCLEPYGEDAQQYAHAAAFVPVTCEDEVVQLLVNLRRNAPEYARDGREPFFNAEQNAVVVNEAESYYRQMIRGGATTWNIRDRHMFATLDRLMAHHGEGAKAIVWAHNTHVGDARFTDMADDGMVNVGQLVREQHGGDGVVVVGFAGYRGEVIAGERWDAPMQVMASPAAPAGTWDALLHQLGGDRLLLFGGEPPRELLDSRGQRAIGVVYNPHCEALGNYVPTVLARRYDALLFCDETHALQPLHVAATDLGEPPETYPFAV